MGSQRRDMIPGVLLTAALLLRSNAAPVRNPRSNSVWFGEGCFWERQYAYVMVELNQTGPFQRTNASVSSLVGYAGAKGTGAGGLVCYDNSDPTNTDYGSLGYCEAVSINLDVGNEEAQFSALVDDFYASFTPTAQGFMRPDLPPLLPYGDVGAPYRTVVGIPGGVHGPLFGVLNRKNVRRGPYNMTMNLKEDATGNMTQDETNTVWVMDSTEFPFYQAEQYHQFHSNFFPNPDQPPEYPDWYLNGLFNLQKTLGKIPNTGCPDSYCPLGGSGSGGCHW